MDETMDKNMDETMDKNMDENVDNRSPHIAAWTAMQEMTNTTLQNSQHPEMCVTKFRKTLNDLVLAMFELPGGTDEDAGLVKLFHCISHCMEEFPQIFVIPKQTVRPHETNDIEPRKKAISLAFTKWLIARLFQFLSRPDMSKYHSFCTSLLISLWKLLRMRDVSTFCNVTVELVSFATELITIQTGKYNSINDNGFIDKEYFFKAEESKHLLETTNLNLSECLIKTIPGSPCASLQIQTLRIILEHVPVITQFVSRVVPSIWVICCHHIEKGNLELKQVSLDLISSLKTHDGLPKSPPIRRYLADCTLAFLEYIYQLDVNERDWVETEKCFCSIMPEVLMFPSDSFRMHNTAFTLLRLISRVKSNNLQKVIGDCLFQCIKQNIKLDVPWENALIKLFGQLQEPEWLVKSFCLLLQTEVENKRPRKEKLPKTINQQSIKVQDTKTWKLIMNHLRSFDETLMTQEALIQHLHCTCEVLLLSIFILKSGHPLNLTQVAVNEQRFGICGFSGSIAWSEENLLKFYHLILWYISLKLNLQAWLPLDAEWWVFAVGMVSLPWPFTATSTFDFPELPHPVNAELKTMAETHLDTRMKAVALQLLGTFPSEVAVHWRMHLLNNELCSKVIELQVAALQSLQLFLHVMGSEYFRHFESTLRCLTDKASIPVIKEMTVFWGKLSCIMSRASRINWCSEKFNNGYFTVQIECHNSDALLAGTDVEQRFDEMWKYFIGHSSSSVRLVMISELKHVMEHTGGQGRLLDLSTVLLEDRSYDVREAFSKCMPFYWSALKKSGRSVESFILHIKEVYLLAKGRGNGRLQETTLLTFGSLGKMVDGTLLSLIVVILLENLILPLPFVSAIACLQLKNIALVKNIKTNGLFQRFRRPISKFLFEALHNAQERGDSDPLEILGSVVKVFDFPDSKSLLMGTLPDVLPYLVMKTSSTCTAVIRCLAKHLQTNKRELLVNYFKYIFCYLVCNCSTSEMENALSYVEKETEIEIGGLMRCNCQRLYNELLLHVGSYYDEVFKGLAILASKDERYKNSQLIEQPEQMAEFLQPRFLGFLAFFDAQILNSNILLEDKQLAVTSLVTVLKLMGSKHITSVRMKVMTTLRIILHFTDKAFLNVCCQAWDTFVHILNPSVVGPMLSQIISTLLPIFESCIQGVSKILDYLIIENKDNFGSFFKDLYFIPDIPELAHIHAVLKDYQEQPTSQGDLRELLQRLLRGICHENLDVRRLALSNLKAVIGTHQGTLQYFILRSDLVDPLVTQLVDKLLFSCRDADIQTRSLIAQCLGQLGAIDPGRLNMNTWVANDEQMKIYSGIDDDNFVVDVVNELVRCFLGAVDTRKQDCSSYAIQEVLNVYQCRDTDEATSHGGRLWSKFPEHIQEVIAPLLHSRYVASMPRESANMPHPIYFSSKGRTFHDWIKNWSGFLIPKVRHPKAKRIFQACAMIIRHDVNIALFLLPHILFYILVDGLEQDMNTVFNEMMAVLKNSGGNQLLDSDLHHMSIQAVFSVLDHLKKSVEKQASLGFPVTFHNQAPTTLSASVDAQNTVKVNGVLQFLDKIPKDTLARTSYDAQAYSRALMNLEAHIRKNPQSFQEQLSFLQKLYAALDEPDGIAGVIAVRQETSLLAQILSHESSGQPEDALPCYEKAIEVESGNLSLHQGLLRCLMDLDQPHTALTYCNGLLASRQDWIRDINHFRVEAAWKLTNWDVLEGYLNSSSVSTSWGFGIGKILSAIKSKNKKFYLEQLDLMRSEQMAPISAASMENGSYQRGYQHIVRLQMLDELEKGTEIFLDHNPQVDHNYVRNLLIEWGNRKQFVQSSMRFLEPVLNLRRVLLGMAKEQVPDMSQQLEQEIGKCWLYSAKVARKSGHLQRAYSSLLTASKYSLTHSCLEQAKLHWQKGEQEHAILRLQKVIRDYYPQIQTVQPGNTSQNKDYMLAWAKTKLMLARYTEESSNLESNAIIQMYRDVLDINPEWEDGHFFLAQFYDRILCTTEHKDKRGDLIGHIVKHFGTSLFYGCRYVYQSMPRMISLWLEFGTSCAEMGKAQKTGPSKAFEALQKMLLNLNKLITTFAEQLPSYLFLTAFSQLISRICHANTEVFNTLKEIIAKLLVTYPQQAMWMMMAVSKSSYEIRVCRCEEIFSCAQKISPPLVKFLTDATKLTDRFLELCNKKVETSVTSLSISTHFRGLLRLLEDLDFSEILIPRQSCLMVALPTGQCSHLNHEPFVHGQIYICGIKDTVEIMPSLQRPKKITLKGTDGKFYDMMCKPKDDLRKDCRLMEFNSVVNKFLLKDTESRKRQLHIRTYAVVPLNEECGLIEWVPNLKGLRIILNNIYKEKNMHTTGNELKRLGGARTLPLEQKIEIFSSKLLPRFPPVFSEWFLRTFSDPTTWYLARVSYARTTAVMSMVGYILGLGDRHGENILFDSSCGDTIHVDFNCLFNKGETFDWPELVPFRLTHNMVDAMGPLGYEGIYRKSCETTLRVMRKQIDTLMSLLKPFIHDPLLEWSHSAKVGASRAKTQQGEITNERAMVHVQDIEYRLKGIIKSKITKTKSHGLPLSVEGQVNYLIQEATNIKNLCQMYIGWAAYM